MKEEIGMEDNVKCPLELNNTSNSEYDLEDWGKELCNLLQKDAIDKILKVESTKHCTYDMGYIRQHVFACKTCYEEIDGIKQEGEENKDEEVRHCGLCLGCSLHCHQGHTLYELFDKRAFKCDCGTSKYGRYIYI